MGDRACDVIDRMITSYIHACMCACVLLSLPTRSCSDSLLANNALMSMSLVYLSQTQTKSTMRCLVCVFFSSPLIHFRFRAYLFRLCHFFFYLRRQSMRFSVHSFNVYKHWWRFHYRLAAAVCPNFEQMILSHKTQPVILAKKKLMPILWQHEIRSFGDRTGQRMEFIFSIIFIFNVCLYSVCPTVSIIEIVSERQSRQFKHAVW